MNGVKMEKCYEKTHSVVQLLLMLWMISLIHIAAGGMFRCSRSNMSVPVTSVCDGYYNCDNYEDESTCRYPATYLPEGESHFISLPQAIRRREYDATLLQTNATNGFRVAFLYSFFPRPDGEVLIGTGNDPSDIQSIIATIHGPIDYDPDDVYVNTNEMWLAAIGGRQYTRHRMDVGVTAIELLNLFPCSGSNMSVSVTLVCDGLYNCDNYEDESSCNYSATYLLEGESHVISLPYTRMKRLNNVTLLQTNATNGFRVAFQDVYLRHGGDKVLIGTGNDPFDKESVITTVHGVRFDVPDDVYVDTNEMWFAVIGGWQMSHISMDVVVTAIDLLNLFPCSGSNMNVSVTLVCDGFYNCDNYKDESSCNYSATYLEEGESHVISFSRTTTMRLYNASIVQTNALYGFRVVFQYHDTHHYDFEVQIGTGNNPSDVQSVITTIDRDINHGPDDVYVETNVMWLAVIGAERYAGLEMNVTIISIELSTLFDCSSSNISVSPIVLCDGQYHCDHYEDELACDFLATYLEEGDSHFISLSYISNGRLFNITLLQTNTTNGFRIVFHNLELYDYHKVQIGTGNDPSDIQSVIKSMMGHINPDDVYVDTNEMWFAIIEGKGYHGMSMNVEIISIDLSDLFVCSSSNMSVSPTVLCDGVYQCDHYEDESACNHSAIHLEEDESHYISLTGNERKRLYNAYILQTNATNGFQVVFRNKHASLYGAIFQIGTGNNPSDIQSVITTIHGYVWNIPDDVFVGTDEMWFTIIGAQGHNRRSIEAEIISIDLSLLFTCSSSNKFVPKTALCDGLYDCDHYEDESACNFSSKYFEEGESYFIYKSSSPASRLYNITLLQTNAMIGFRVVFRDLYLYDDDKVQIGTGNDPSDQQSVIATIHGRRDYANDVYLDTNDMWFAVIGASYSWLRMDVEIIAIDLSTVCQNISWISPRFERVEFPVGENGTWANSTGMCPFNTTQANVPIGKALCIGDDLTQSQWQPVDNCGPFRNVTDILTEIAKVIISEENAGEVSQQVAYVASNFGDFTSDDITLVAEITSNIVQLNLTGEEVTKSLTSIVSHIAQVQTWELEAAEEEGGAISEFLQAFEEHISRVEVADGGMFNIQQPNVAVQIQSVLADDLTRDGLVLSLAGCSLSDLTKSNITIDAPTQDERDDVLATRPDIIAQVNIPPSVLSAISSTARISGSPSNGSGEYVRVNFIVFSTPALFISKSLRTISPDNNLPGKTLYLCVRPPRYNLEDLSPYNSMYIKPWTYPW